MKQRVDIPYYKKHSIICDMCKGKHLQKNGQTDQKSVIKDFGIIPNHCVPDENGKPHCPAFVK